MRKSGFVALAALSLAACGGGERVYLGATQVMLDGTASGIDESALTFVSGDIGGFAYGLAEDVDATVFGNSASASPGDRGNFAISGLLPERDVGRAYAGGTATFSGRYEMVTFTGVEQSSNAANWSREAFSGPMTARIELHEEDLHLDDPDHAHSHDFDEVVLFARSSDERLVFDDVAIYRPLRPALPSTQPHAFSGGSAIIGGTQVSLRGESVFGSDGMVASFHGQGADTLVSGGFLMETE